MFFWKSKKEKELEMLSKLISHEKATAAQDKLQKSYSDGNGKLAKESEENYMATSELVFSCVDYISKAAGQATFKVYKVDTKGNKVKADKKNGLREWEKSPNPFFTWGEYIELMVQNLLLSGTSFPTLELVGNRLETWLLNPPSSVEIVPDAKNFMQGIIINAGGEPIAYPAEDVMIIRNPTQNNMYYGIPTIRPLFDTLTLEGTAINTLTDFYSGSTLLSGILQSEYSLTPEQTTDIRNQFKTLFGKKGIERGGTAVLPNNLQYIPIQSNPKDSMLLDSLGVSEKRVLRVFRLNAIALGGEATATTHPQELMKMVFNTAVRPYLYRIADSISLALQKKYGTEYLVEFDFDRITELDTALDVKASSAKTLYSTGVASLNEARDLINLPPLDDENASKHIIPKFLTGDTLQYVEDPLQGNPGDQGGTSSTKPGSTDPQGGAADMNGTQQGG